MSTGQTDSDGGTITVAARHQQVGWWGLLIFATAPAAYYLYGVPYAEGLYILAAGAAFLLVEHGHPEAEIIVPITFSVIINTVILYGLTAGYVARRLGLMQETQQQGVPAAPRIRVCCGL